MNRDAFIGGLVGGLAGVGVFLIFSNVVQVAQYYRRKQAKEARESGMERFK